MKLVLPLLACLLCPLSQVPAPDDEFFDFQSDVRLFTAYAFMNAAGNDAEWRKAGMHPLRLAVREELKGRLEPAFRKKIEDFNNGHGGSWTLYGSYALLTEGPPDFRVHYDPRTTPYGREEEASKAGLSALLAEFYRQAGLAGLWQKYRPVLQAENDRFKPFARQALAEIESYCRLETGFFARDSKRIHFQFSPLLLYFTAWTMKVDGEMWIVAGPQEGGPDASSFYHEALHSVVGPLGEKYARQVDGLSELLAVAKTKGSVGYDAWPELAEECFVRALDKVLQARLYGLDGPKLRERLEDEYKLGFILCPAVAESLPEYERQGLPFEEYFPAILKNIDIAKEKARWERYWRSVER